MSKKYFTITIDLPGAEKLIKYLGVDPQGEMQKKFTQVVIGVAKEYLPLQNAVMQSKTFNDGDGIIYDVPYARYHWHGKLMVDPNTKSSWAPKNVQKVLASPPVDLKYHADGMTNGGLRGPRWVERAWIDHGETIIRNFEEELSKR